MAFLLLACLAFLGTETSAAGLNHVIMGPLDISNPEGILPVTFGQEMRSIPVTFEGDEGVTLYQERASTCRLPKYKLGCENISDAICNYRANQGRCNDPTYYDELVEYHCKKSCNWCESGFPPKPTCFDSWKSCTKYESWICKSNLGPKNCKKTCNSCWIKSVQE